MAYTFHFAYMGGSIRVKIEQGEDIRHLSELDEKLWTVQSCPVSGLEMDTQTLQLVDRDHDNCLHVKDIIATADWLCDRLNPECLMKGTDEVVLTDIIDEGLLAVAQEIAGDKQVICLADVDAAMAAVQVPVLPVPEAPFPADVMAAYEAKQAEYATWFEDKKLEQMGLATIAEDRVAPGMKEKDFMAMGEAIAAWKAQVAAIEQTNADAKAQALAPFTPLREMVVLHRDFYCLLRNFISFEDFYNGQAAIFQAGTLVIDQRACALALRVNDMAKQDAQAPASGMFLVYCDCVNKAGATMKIVAAVTMGEIRNLTVGKNALFYDRQGNDWNAVITKVVDNPISIKQAFWSPYRKFAQWVQSLINKSASEKNNKVFEQMTSDAQATIDDPKAAAEARKQQAFDIAKFAGIFAAIGMAVGYIGSFLTSLANGINSLPWWQLLIWIAGLLLVISGPAMVMAGIKLRSRNLAPILNANGWAINADVIVSVIFGATLTKQAQFPLIKFPKKGKK